MPQKRTPLALTAEFFKEWIYPAYRLQSFFEDWIYPGYCFKNYFFRRYDIVRMPELRRSCYYEIDYRMYLANMELIRHFIEECDWEMVGWYDEKDEKGNVKIPGMKYGLAPGMRVYLPEYKGKYVIDIVKEIYDWHTLIMPKLADDYRFGLKNMAETIAEESVTAGNSEKTSGFRYSFPERDTISPEDLENYLASIRKILKGEKTPIVDVEICGKIERNLDLLIDYGQQKYLHASIEVRQFLSI